MATILIVEDSPTQAERLQLIIEAADLHAEVVHDADAALARLAAGGIDLVVSDIVMPGRSGYELCREIKALPEGQRLPVILLTTRREPMDIIRGLECGADNFYTKPYDPQRLVERLRNILYNRRLRAEGKLQLGVQVSMFGRTFSIGSGREQILDLLVSTFEDIVQTNAELERTRDELAQAKQRLDAYVAMLEGRVEDSEGRYRAVFEGIGEGVLLIAADGQILSANPAAARMFGHSAESIPGLRPEQLFRVSAAAPLPAGVACAEAGQVSPRPAVERVGLRADGSGFPLSVSTSPVRIGGAEVCVWLLRDLSHERAVELQLRQAQKMEAMGQLTGGIAHDFNNQLTVILGNSEELEAQLAVRPELAALAAMISAAALRGSELTRRLLAFARRQPLEPVATDLVQLLERMHPLLHRSLGEHVEIDLRPAANAWPAVVDASQLESAVLNLCLNARDAMPSGGLLRIELENTRLQAGDTVALAGLSAGDYVVLRVLDSGCGIAAEHLERVFEPFFTTKPVGKGTGMGLPMVYGFAKQSGGHLEIDSEPGLGTTVSLWLPRAVQAPRLQRASTETVQGGDESILLVEDDPLVRGYALEQLRALGYAVLSAASGPEALQILDDGVQIDLLFTDVVMPGGMSGLELAEAARARRPGLRVLFSSGYAEDVIVHNGRLDPGVRLLGKPYRRAQLAQTVREALADPAAASA